jgi:hypothetical protein
MEKQGKKSKEEAVENKEEQQEQESGGPKGLEPTRYGDWERKGVCVDF